MTSQEVASKENQSPRKKKVVRIIAVVAAGFAICAAMKAFLSGKSGNGCPCLAASDQADSDCSSSEED